MEFNYEILKVNRKNLKYTQQQVADAIGATVRTYQKWENGETTPDGCYLLRLMNWLDIRNVQDVVRYTK
jgi:transcriptional regulator with XRE-family HTH domain